MSAHQRSFATGLTHSPAVALKPDTIRSHSNRDAIKLAGNVEVHSESSRAQRVSFGFQPTAWIHNILTAILCELRVNTYKDLVQLHSLYCHHVQQAYERPLGHKVPGQDT